MHDSLLSTLVSIAPFLLLLALWFFLLRRGSKGGWGMNYYSRASREALREEVVPEIRALRESIEALRKDLNDRR